MSNARNLARLLPNASGQLPPANIVGGKVLQVVSGTTTSMTGTTVIDSWVDTSLSATITPSSATSKILVLVTQNIGIDGSSTTDKQVNLGLFRDSTLILGGIGWDDFRIYAVNSWVTRSGITHFDSPATTSAVTYKTKFSLRTPSGATAWAQYSGNRSNIILMEIAA